MDSNNNFSLVTRNIKEILGNTEELENVFNSRSLRIYWGTAATGRIHIGYFIPLLKIADFLNAGCEVTILIADIHAYLDNMKSSLEQLKHRSEYYEIMIKEMLKSIDVDISKLKFIRGSEFQLSQKYTMDVYRFASLVSLNEAKHSGAEVVKQSDNPKINGLLYPLLQCLDEEYLNVDVQFGGTDQRKIFVLSREFMNKIGYKKRYHLMNELVPGLRFEKNNNNKNIQAPENKMSSSKNDTKIDILDSKGQIRKKINKAYCLEGDIEDNTPLILLEKVIFPILDNKKEYFIINRKEEYGGIITYKTYSEVADDFKNNLLHPGDLKLGIINNLNNILAPIRECFSFIDKQNLLKQAY